MIFFSCDNSNEQLHDTLFTGSYFRASEMFSEVKRTAEIVRFEARLMASSANSRQSTSSSLFQSFNAFEAKCLDAIEADDEFRSNYHMISEYNQYADLFDGDLSSVYKEISDGSARIANEDSLISVSQIMDNLDFSSLINGDLFPDASRSINELTNRLKYLAVNEEAIILENDDFDREGFQNKLKQEVLLFEEEISEDEHLLLDDKKLIFASTSMLYLSLDDVFGIAEIIDAEANSTGGRLDNFWKKAANLLLEVAGLTAAATVIYSVFFIGVTIGTALCLSDYCWGTGGFIGVFVELYLGSLAYEEITSHKFEL